MSLRCSAVRHADRPRPLRASRFPPRLQRLPWAGGGSVTMPITIPSYHADAFRLIIPHACTDTGENRRPYTLAFSPFPPSRLHCGRLSSFEVLFKRMAALGTNEPDIPFPAHTFDLWTGPVQLAPKHPRPHPIVSLCEQGQEPRAHVCGTYHRCQGRVRSMLPRRHRWSLMDFVLRVAETWSPLGSFEDRSGQDVRQPSGLEFLA